MALFLPPPYYHPLPSRVQEKNVVYERDAFSFGDGCPEEKIRVLLTGVDPVAFCY